MSGEPTSGPLWGISKIMSEKALLKLLLSSRLRLVFFLVLICAALTACYPATQSEGTVKDDQGQPVADATVRIDGKSAKSETVKTNQDGKFDFSEVEIVSHQNPIEIQLTVEKPGFDKFSKPISFNSRNVDEIILQKSNR